MSVQCFRIFLGPLLPFLGRSLKVLQIKIAQCYRAVELSLQHCTRTREPLMMGELKIEAKQGMWRDTRTWISKGSLCHDRKLTFFCQWTPLSRTKGMRPEETFPTPSIWREVGWGKEKIPLGESVNMSQEQRPVSVRRPWWRTLSWDGHQSDPILTRQMNNWRRSFNDILGRKPDSCSWVFLEFSLGWFASRQHTLRFQPVCNSLLLLP